MGEESSKKPTMEEVCAYATPIVRKFIAKFAVDFPREHKEEIEQCAYLRLIKAYPNLAADKGWKSFTYNHCRGAVLDYLKFGNGFNEDRRSCDNSENEGVPKLRERVFMTNSEGDDLTIDQVLGAAGIFSEVDFDQVHIKWELVARMASQDDKIHVFAKHIRGFKLDEIGQVFGVSRGRIAQLINQFVEQFDDDSLLEHSPWLRQTAYAFGLCKHFGIKDVDQSRLFNIPLGHDLRPVDLDSDEPFDQNDFNQLNLWDTSA